MAPPDELDELPPEEELEDEELDELLDEELLEELLEELEEDELLLEDELDEDELEELLEDELPMGAEHSLTPPATLLPAPKVASEQTKLPLNTLKVNLSARPNATLVLVATEQVLFSVQMVT